MIASENKKLCDTCVHHDACLEGDRPADTVVKHDTRKITECSSYVEEEQDG